MLVTLAGSLPLHDFVESHWNLGYHPLRYQPTSEQSIISRFKRFEGVLGWWIGCARRKDNRRQAVIYLMKAGHRRNSC
jgi:hypothetical protein